MAGTDKDVQIGSNLAELRGSLSQEELAARMRGLGYKWSQSTVWSIERGDRPLRLTEAGDVLSCLGFDPELDMSKLLTNNPIDGKALTEIARMNSLIKSVGTVCDNIALCRLTLESYIDPPASLDVGTPSEKTVAQIHEALESSGADVLVAQMRDRLKDLRPSDNRREAAVSEEELKDYFSRIDSESGQEPGRRSARRGGRKYISPRRKIGE